MDNYLLIKDVNIFSILKKENVFHVLVVVSKMNPIISVVDLELS